MVMCLSSRISVKQQHRICNYNTRWKLLDVKQVTERLRKSANFQLGSSEKVSWILGRIQIMQRKDQGQRGLEKQKQSRVASWTRERSWVLQSRGVVLEKASTRWQRAFSADSLPDEENKAQRGTASSFDPADSYISEIASANALLANITIPSQLTISSQLSVLSYKS